MIIPNELKWFVGRITCSTDQTDLAGASVEQEMLTVRVIATTFLLILLALKVVGSSSVSSVFLSSHPASCFCHSLHHYHVRRGDRSRQVPSCTLSCLYAVSGHDMIFNGLMMFLV